MILCSVLVVSCGGADEDLLYFPPAKKPLPDGAPDADISERSCTISLTSQLCVVIAGEKIEVGTDNDEPLCVDVSPFPFHISGGEIELRGNEFPDITVEGHGLPVPIVINGHGDGDGSDNVGLGTIDAVGNITINGFSFFINALGAAAEIPDLVLTTGATEDLEFHESVSGRAPDATGAMILVGATSLGHTFDAADEILLGASLVATFTGVIAPPLSECGGASGPRSIAITQIATDEHGAQVESPLPEDTYLEISTGTYIAETPEDVGEKFEATARFKATNVGTSTVAINLPPKVGAFLFKALDGAMRDLAPGKSFLFDVTFRPKAESVEPGVITESILVGNDPFTLRATALSPEGDLSVDRVDEEGSVEAAHVESVNVGDIDVAATAQKDFFLCETMECHDTTALTACIPCPDPATQACELLALSADGKPLAEVTADCSPAHPDAAPLLTIDVEASTNISILSGRQVIAIRNTGVEEMTIHAMRIEDIAGSQSTGEFSIPSRAVFIAEHFADIEPQLTHALNGGKPNGSSFPITLPPYLPGIQETTAWVLISYTPTDLVGAEGEAAGVGSRATDRATLIIETESTSITTTLEGSTTIREVPALELYFKTSTGTQLIAEGDAFPFRGVTANTRDVAFPFFLRLADTAAHAMRITSITIRGEDASFFEFLDSAEKIESVQPAAGEGMRCSLAVVDAATGEMIDEIFDLKPVAVTPPGVDLMPGAHSLETMPLFGCINFHRDPSDISQRFFSAELLVTAEELDANGNPTRNPDGSFRITEFSATLMAAINPRAGKMVMRIPQTVAVILNPQFPTITGISARKEFELQMQEGHAIPTDAQIFTAAVILDPFDEETIKNASGTEVVTTPADGLTAVFRPIDVHPVSQTYDDPALFDHAHLIHDGLLDEGLRGVYEDYPNVPENLQANGWRIFTSSLSYPGPAVPYEDRPQQPSQCEVINPCDPDDLKKFSDAGVPSGEPGACAFFYASAGRYDSPAFHAADVLPGGEHTHLCNAIDTPQKLLDANGGRYSLDGHLHMEDIGLRFFGPTYFHNPHGPLGRVPPLDTIWHTSFTTGIIKPQSRAEEPHLIPDERIDISRQAYKINLTDPTHVNPPLCEANTKNRRFGGHIVSTWKYLAPLLTKDEEGLIPAGCPEDNNSFAGGTAYLRGRAIDHETGIATVISLVKGGTEEALTFALQEIQLFVILNGWFCDPLGNEENFEGARCYDAHMNERDAAAQISILDGGGQ